jgi:hypothetical protein
VLGEQSSGKAVGRVRVTCQGTVRAHLVNRSGRTVVYRLRVGTKLHKVAVKSQARKQVVTRGRPRAQVTLRAAGTRLDRTRIPQRCQAPGVLPDTGLRVTTR